MSEETGTGEKQQNRQSLQREEPRSYILWDCFANWALTLEKIKDKESHSDSPPVSESNASGVKPDASLRPKKQKED